MGKESERGFALVLVIVIMLLISFLAGQLILNVSTELKVVYNQKKREKELGLAQAGVNLAVFRLLDKPLQDLGQEWASLAQGFEYKAYLPTGRISYMVTSESGKIDINNFDKKLLMLFLEYMKLDPDEQRILIDSLLDWQDKDELHRLNGAERDYYEELEEPYVPRNGNIIDPAEFFLVKGAEKLAGKFQARDIFTVYNHSKKINFNSLTPVMLDFLVQGDELRKREYLEAKQMQGQLGIAQARRILGEDRFDQCASFLSFSSGNDDRYYSISSRGEAGIRKDSEPKPMETAMEIYVLFRKQGNRIKYLAWNEDLS